MYFKFYDLFRLVISWETGVTQYSPWYSLFTKFSSRRMQYLLWVKVVSDSSRAFYCISFSNLSYSSVHSFLFYLWLQQQQLHISTPVFEIGVDLCTWVFSARVDNIGSGTGSILSLGWMPREASPPPEVRCAAASLGTQEPRTLVWRRGSPQYLTPQTTKNGNHTFESGPVMVVSSGGDGLSGCLDVHEGHRAQEHICHPKESHFYAAKSGFAHAAHTSFTLRRLPRGLDCHFTNLFILHY